MKHRLGLLLALFALALGAFAQTATAGLAPSQITKRNVSDAKLAAVFFDLLKARDTAGLKAFLSPSLLLQRSDGTYFTKSQYLKRPSVVEAYRLVDVVGKRSGDVRVIRYTAITRQTIDGKQITNDPVPRLSTYVWAGKRWQLISHANFSPIPK